MVAIIEPLSYATFMAVAQFPAMQSQQLSRLLASALIRRHGAYLIPSFRRRQLRHDDGINRLVLLVTHTDAVEAGRLTGDATVWRQRDTGAVSLHPS